MNTEFTEELVGEEPPLQKEEVPKPLAAKPARRSGSAPLIFACAAVVFGMLAYVMYEKSETSKIYNEVAQASARLDELESENNRMKSELEAQMALKNVEDYAENVLGLQKLEVSQIEYIQVRGESNVEIPDDERNFFVSVKKRFNSIMEYIFS